MLVLLAHASAAQYIGQGNDGNPHNWDRRRRCDGTQYSPPCGVCEGYGGIPHGDENDQVTLTSCTPVNRTGASEPVRPVWSARMTMAPYYAVQIGPKKDPFCFQAIPGNSSAGELCYQRQTGSQLYDMTGAFDSLRFDVDLSTRVGNVTSGVIAHDKYLWIVNHLPWYALGIKQCICTEPKEGGDPRTASVFPLALHWVDNLRYVGRERLGIEYAWQEEELEHWAFGPHHVWTRPDTGSIIRMWQPYNGLQVMPNGTLPSAVDGRLLGVPPPECTAASHLTAKIGCNASGYPKPKPAAAAVVEAPPEHDGERWRAVEQVPRGEYRGASFDAMSQVLSGWLRRGGAATRPCEEWEVEELQQLQATLYLVRHATYDEVYRAANDSRALAKDVDALQTDWRQLNAAAEAEGLGEMHRDGHCHEAAMWWVHHTREDAKALLRQQGVTIPLLSPLRHACPDGASAAAQQVCGAYDYKVSCASCHSAPTAASSPQAQPTAVSLARRLLGF